MENILKYPRTRHVEGSRLQTGDEDLKSILFQDIQGQFLVLEEKVDGANSGISFSDEGKLLLQSRGHYLNGGYGEKQFDLFKVIRLCEAYGARVHLIYIEVPYEELMRRNQIRERKIPIDVLEKLIRKLDVPAVMEAYTVEYKAEY